MSAYTANGSRGDLENSTDSAVVHISSNMIRGRPIDSCLSKSLPYSLIGQKRPANN